MAISKFNLDAGYMNIYMPDGKYFNKKLSQIAAV